MTTTAAKGTQNLQQLQRLVLGLARGADWFVVAEDFETAQGADTQRPRPKIRGSGRVARNKPSAADDLPDMVGLIAER
ncbi:MAG: hypothetical protein NTX45_27485 [Proteobacteria bacterium]|nr:hypothetical protein [Pseudomonadota bacterium]